MQTVGQMIDDMLAHEGGYVNDPDDPGGATNYGVTIGTMRRLGVDVDGDGDVDIHDVQALPLATARKIYKEQYFVGPRIDDLPSIIQANVFDMNVNSGNNAFKILQRLLALFGVEVAIDGALGPQTIGATNSVAGAAPDHLNDAYAIARRNYYFGLADRRPKSRKYVVRRDGGKAGWITRCESFMKPKYKMSAAQFGARIARW